MAGIPGVKQPQTVTAEGRSIAPVPEGVIFRDLTTHTDARGSLVELFSPRWNWHPDPLAHAYVFTVRPGIIKGWGRHAETEDRYANLFGEAMVVLFDGRESSPTEGMISEVPVSEHHRRLMTIPAGVWHAIACLGDRDFVGMNFKTIPFDHENPDKYTLPLDTHEIPYDFERLRRSG
ncbi:MAG TPA: dTDP-4-dehydrorhamnose 3,5-epimerase family protein [Acidimicrobiia bacterium]|nr:dTDP-4-dehydrorhamnose 3,5-epimerase family protein [Acidimicrobiia bacterium]